jgi:hypothetical protein
MSQGDAEARRDLRISENFLHAVQLLTRRRDAQRAEAQGVVENRLLKTLNATEDLGLYGQNHPLQERDLKIWEWWISVVDDALITCEPEDIPWIMTQLEIMTGDVMARSRSLLSIEGMLPVQTWMRHMREQFQTMDNVDLGAGAGEGGAEQR